MVLICLHQLKCHPKLLSISNLCLISVSIRTATFRYKYWDSPNNCSIPLDTTTSTLDTFVLLSCHLKKVGSFALRFHILLPKQSTFATSNKSNWDLKTSSAGCESSCKVQPFHIENWPITNKFWQTGREIGAEKSDAKNENAIKISENIT